MNNDEPIPSPFLGELMKPSEKDQEFLVAIALICESYGYKDFFIAFTDVARATRTARQWKSVSNGLGEDMVQSLEIITKGMRATWEEIKKRKLL